LKHLLLYCGDLRVSQTCVDPKLEHPALHTTHGECRVRSHNVAGCIISPPAYLKPPVRQLKVSSWKIVLAIGSSYHISDYSAIESCSVKEPREHCHIRTELFVEVRSKFEETSEREERDESAD